MVKRCFVCGHKEDANGHCTNPKCPRYLEPEKVVTTKNNDATK